MGGPELYVFIIFVFFVVINSIASVIIDALKTGRKNKARTQKQRL